MLLGKAVSVADIGVFNTVQGHVHGTNAQHRGVEVVAVKHPRMKMLPLFVVAEQRCVMVSEVFPGSNEEAAGARCRITDHVVGGRLYQLDHEFDDVAWGSELTILTGTGNLAQHVLVDIALGVPILHRDFVQHFHGTS